MPDQSEAQVLAAILREIGSRPDVRLWRANAGAARDVRTGRIVRFGVPGQADLSGIWLAPIECPECGHIQHTGRRLEIECKSATGRLSAEQRRFLEMIRRFGGVGMVARSVTEAMAALDLDAARP